MWIPFCPLPLNTHTAKPQKLLRNGRRTWQKAQGVKLTSRSPRSQSDWISGGWAQTITNHRGPTAPTTGLKGSATDALLCHNSAPDILCPWLSMSELFWQHKGDSVILVKFSLVHVKPSGVVVSGEVGLLLIFAPNFFKSCLSSKG